MGSPWAPRGQPGAGPSNCQTVDDQGPLRNRHQMVYKYRGLCLPTGSCRSTAVSRPVEMGWLRRQRSPTSPADPRSTLNVVLAVTAASYRTSSAVLIDKFESRVDHHPWATPAAGPAFKGTFLGESDRREMGWSGTFLGSNADRSQALLLASGRFNQPQRGIGRPDCPPANAERCVCTIALSPHLRHSGEEQQ